MQANCISENKGTDGTYFVCPFFIFVSFYIEIRAWNTDLKMVFRHIKFERGAILSSIINSDGRKYNHTYCTCFLKIFKITLFQIISRFSYMAFSNLTAFE